MPFFLPNIASLMFSNAAVILISDSDLLTLLPLDFCTIAVMSSVHHQECTSFAMIAWASGLLQ